MLALIVFQHDDHMYFCHETHVYLCEFFRQLISLNGWVISLYSQLSHSQFTLTVCQVQYYVVWFSPAQLVRVKKKTILFLVQHVAMASVSKNVSVPAYQ